jgi:hypothetical protein
METVQTNYISCSLFVLCIVLYVLFVYEVISFVMYLLY